MTKWAVYDSRGRWALWGAATYAMVSELSDEEDDYLNDVIALAGWGLATGALLVPELLPRIVGYGVTHAWSGVRYVVGALAPYAGAVVANVVAPVTAGYVIGAVAGTAIADTIFGEEGAQTALGFYSGGLLPGTEAPDLTDYQYILKPTAPGGPVSLYDIGKKGVSGTVLLGRILWRKRPRLYRNPKPWMI